MRVVILRFLWLLAGISCWIWVRGQDQDQGQELLVSRLGSARTEFHTQLLANATSYLTRRFVASRTNTMAVRRSCKGCPWEVVDRQRWIIRRVRASLAQEISVLLQRGDPEESSPDYTLFVVNNEEAFSHHKFLFSDELLEREFFFVVVVTEYQTPDTIEETAARIIVSSLHLPVTNVVVVAQSSDGQVSTYGYTLFKRHCTLGITIRRSNHFDLLTGEPLQNMTDLYPVRKALLGGCPLNVSANHLPPHFIYRRKREQDLPKGTPIPHQDVAGIDWELLQLLAKALNFRVNLYVPREPSQIFGEGNVSGCFAQLAEGSVQLAIGGLSGSDRRRWLFSKSTVYHQSQFVMVVRRDRFMGRFGPLLLPFGHMVWLVIAGILLLAILVTCGLSRRLRLRHSMENFVLMCIGNPIPLRRLPGSGFLRYLLASWLLLTLVLRCAYQARLFDVLRFQHHRPLPQDLPGLVQENYTLVSNGYHDFYPQEMTRILGESFSSRFLRVQRAGADERLTTISLVSNLAYWTYHHRNISHLTYVREPIYTYQLVLYFQRRSFLKPAVDRKIKQLLSAGVIAQIERRYMANADIVQPDREIFPRITNKVMVGAYRIHFLVIGWATLAFLLERMSLRWALLRRGLDWMHRS
ncbi:hypothetical protein KR009_005646 [Drosophila setifemur]|nr:hypothetical protein KR009_005646 [Drosophila setifemur]